MFRRLIEEFRSRGPLRRSSAEVGALLAAQALQWPSERQLLFRPDAYTRTCAYRDSHFEVVVLNWAEGSASPIHDHGDQHCWMLVLAGGLEVDDYVRLDAADTPGYAHVELRGSRTLEPGDMDLRSGRFDLHRVAAAAGRHAVSLHVYAGPLREFLVYDEYARRCRTARGQYDAVILPDAEVVRR